MSVENSKIKRDETISMSDRPPHIERKERERETSSDEIGNASNSDECRYSLSILSFVRSFILFFYFSHCFYEEMKKRKNAGNVVVTGTERMNRERNNNDGIRN